MSPRDWQMRLEDINESLERILKYVAGLDQASWQNDTKTIDAVIRNLGTLAPNERYAERSRS